MIKIIFSVLLVFSLTSAMAGDKKKRSPISKIAKRKDYCSPLDKILNNKNCRYKGKKKTKAKGKAPAEKKDQTTEEKLEETEEFLR